MYLEQKEKQTTYQPDLKTPKIYSFPNLNFQTIFNEIVLSGTRRSLQGFGGWEKEERRESMSLWETRTAQVN